MTSGISDEGVLRKLLQQMNSQIPVRRHSLRSLMTSEHPCYTGKDGREYAIEMGELSMVRSIIEGSGHFDVKLPILVMADARHEQPVWRVEGREECAVITGVLGRAADSEKSTLFLYGPHMAVVRRELPTTTVCMYLP